jgi:hypothetical protein
VITFRFQAREVGGHVHVTVWSGEAGQRGNNGTLTFRPDEWALLRWSLAGSDSVEIDDPTFVAGFA